MSITLYFNHYSSRCLAVKTTLLLTKSEFTETVIDMFKGENQKPAFTNLNPNQTVPAITEGFFSLFESHAIMKYICLQKEDFKLYPNDLQNKALLDSYLDWHENEFTKVLSFAKECYFKPILIGNSVPENRVMLLVDVEEVLQFFVKVFLKNGEFSYIFNQQQPTIADIKATCDLSTLFICNFDFDKFPVLEQYIQRMFKIPELYLSHQELFALILKQKYKNQFIQSIVSQQSRIEQIILYHHPISPSSRAVRSLLFMGKIDFDEKIVDILKSENLQEKFSKINPNQTIPCIKQGQFVLYESHAIMKYICDQYKLQDLYPQQNIKLKAQIDSYLDFHHNEMKLISQVVMKSKDNNNNTDQQQDVDKLLQFFLKVFLNDGIYKYIFNNKTISIADLSAVNEILFLVMINYDFNKVPLIQKYINNILDNQSVKQSCREYFSSLSSNQMQINQYNRQLIASSKKKGCC